MFPKTVASESGARRDVLAEMAARIPPHAAETSQVDRGGHRSKSETRSSSPTPPYHVTRGRGHRRTGLPRDRRASASGGHSHGPWTAETTNCAPGGPAYRSGVVARSDRGGLADRPARLSLRPPVDKEIGEGARGRTSHWPRGKRRARKTAALGSAVVICERGPPVSPPSTADEETLSLRVLKRSSGPPSARR
ncbi:hypothetical protein EVAR_89657_1 [Eumeta japonica]|uniref:Uncharacterized protein n=1 Tax=Eumeta variegata TaxID=151549 RepID=A0A4C1Y8I0_EUMVA|nr:hypothetical protein EVAR_89657_1 [Eumeta japonica]